MVKGGKHRKHPVCGNCSETITEYNETEDRGQKVGLKTIDNEVTMNPIEKYNGNGMAYKCPKCKSVVIEPPLDMLDGDLDKDSLKEKIADRIAEATIDKSRVMERAQELREEGKDMSEALSIAWSEVKEENGD